MKGFVTLDMGLKKKKKILQILTTDVEGGRRPVETKKGNKGSVQERSFPIDYLLDESLDWISVQYFP